jgi:hypothetical protein
MKNYRSLEAHKFFVSGWVQEIFHQKLPSGNVLFIAEVKPSFRSTTDNHRAWCAVEEDGAVILAHCDCMAGFVV